MKMKIMLSAIIAFLMIRRSIYLCNIWLSIWL